MSHFLGDTLYNKLSLISLLCTRLSSTFSSIWYYLVLFGFTVVYVFNCSRNFKKIQFVESSLNYPEAEPEVWPSSCLNKQFFPQYPCNKYLSGVFWVRSNAGTAFCPLLGHILPLPEQISPSGTSRQEHSYRAELVWKKHSWFCTRNAWLHPGEPCFERLDYTVPNLFLLVYPVNWFLNDIMFTDFLYLPLNNVISSQHIIH